MAVGKDYTYKIQLFWHQRPLVSIKIKNISFEKE